MQPAPTAPCFFPLHTQDARQEYRTIAETLVRAGRMDVHNHRLLSSYVAQLDNIIVAQQQKRQIRGSWFAQMDRARNKLKLHELERHLQPVIERPPNKFAHCGFSNRSRVAVEDTDHNGRARRIGGSG
jgi:hypothetical protein